MDKEDELHDEDFSSWEMWQFYAPDEYKEWKTRTKSCKDWVVVGQEEKIQWAKGEFSVMKVTAGEDNDGLIYKEGETLYNVKQMSIWKCKWTGQLKLAIDLDNKWQVEEL